MLRTLKSERFLRRAVFAVFIGAALGFGIFLATSEGLRSIGGGRVGGDFPAFYTAGRIVRAGNGHLLYDFNLQMRSQAELFPGMEDAWLPFPYPPFVAAAYAPFAFLGFKNAYVVHTGVMAFCAVGALMLLRRHVPVLDRNFAAAVAATLTFYPLFRAIIGGQNTALSLLCVAGAAGALASRREVVAGLWLGAWLFKPQLAVPAIVLVLVGGYWRALTGIGGMAVVYYAIGTAVAGADWPVRWVSEGLLPYASVNLELDRANGLSFREVAAHLGVPLLGWLLVAFGAVFVARSAWRTRHQPIALVGSAAAATVLLSPHGIFYDGGLAVMGIVAAAHAAGPAGLRYYVTAWLLGAAQHLRPFFPIPPLTVVLTGVVVWLDRLVGRARRPVT